MTKPRTSRRWLERLATRTLRAIVARGGMRARLPVLPMPALGTRGLVQLSMEFDLDREVVADVIARFAARMQQEDWAQFYEAPCPAGVHAVRATSRSARLSVRAVAQYRIYENRRVVTLDAWGYA